MDNEKALHLLSNIFGFDKFRPGQEEIIDAIIAGENILAIMPTGGGKSLCYQLPALMQSGLTIVISPLIALMRNQVSQLLGFGINAASLNSSNSPAENQTAIDAAIEGKLKLLYLSPERLMRPDTVEFLLKANVKIIATDEAHCISQWGHDFRPEYQQIGKICAALNGVQMLGFTATADEQTRQDISEKLFPAQPKIFLHGFDRPNISLAMSAKNNPKEQLLSFLAEHQNQSGIIYCQSRKKVEATTEFLKTKGLKAFAYHAGMSKEDRAQNQDLFLIEDSIIIVATVAFGMGIDKPDVRFVFHMDLPKNIEGYYQEIGRAGRDNLPASAHTLYGLVEIRQYRQWIDESDAPNEQKIIERQKLNSLVSLCEAPVCRRMVLLDYFGDKCEPCENCDLCQGEIKTRDGTIEAQKALSSIVRTGEIFGMENVINVLLGHETEMSQKHNHQNLSVFGIGKDISRNQWRSIFRQLYAIGLVQIDASRFNRWLVSEQGWQVMRGEKTVALREEILQDKEKTLRPQKAAPVNIENCNEEVLAALKKHRLSIAREKKTPAFVVFGDKTLIEMAIILPKTMGEMLQIHGVGEKKLEQYGEDFLHVIKEARQEG